MDHSPPGFSVHGIFQARILDWVAISFSRGSSWLGDRTRVSHCRQTLYRKLVSKLADIKKMYKKINCLATHHGKNSQNKFLNICNHVAKRSYASPEVRGGGGRSYPTREVRGGGREVLPYAWGQGRRGEELPHARGQGWQLGGATHVQGAVATQAQEGREELFHVQGQEGRLWGHTPHPKWGGAAALCWSSREEITHIQGKRNPNKTVGVARGIRGQTHKP